MPDLAEALDAALRARYRVTEVKTPVSQRRGLLARMNRLEKLHTRAGDTPAETRRRAAASAGIPDRTWRDWRKGTHPPSARSQRKLEAAYTRQITLPALSKATKAKGAPDKVTITAEVRWTDSPRKMYNATKYRTVKLTGMKAAMVPVIRAWTAAGPQAAADAFERAVSRVYRVPDDDEGGPGVRFEGKQVEIEFP